MISFLKIMVYTLTITICSLRILIQLAKKGTERRSFIVFIIYYDIIILWLNIVKGGDFMKIKFIEINYKVIVL